MAPEEEPKSDAPQSDPSGSRPGPRRNRRAGRGRRGRGRGGRPKTAGGESPPPSVEAETTQPPDAEPVFELAEDSGEESREETDAIGAPDLPPELSVLTPSAPSHRSQPASPASVEEAIEEVNGVVDALRTALEEME